MDFKKKALNFLASTMGKWVITGIFAAIIYALIIVGFQSGIEAIAVVIIAACVYFGWKALNRITPQIFLWMSFMGWVIYFVVKFMLSVVIGVFVAPFKIGSMISNFAINTLNEVRNELK